MRKSDAVEKNIDHALPVASLRLLAPPMRLVSAAMWKVMQQRDVMHYGKLVEFITSVSETVPMLMNYRHQAKLTVGLQARLILEQIRVSQSPDSELILGQLDQLRAPVVSSRKKKDQKVEMAVKNFHTLVQTLLKSPALSKQFFQEEFASQYGPEYESAMEKLLWEFLTRLDQLLPVPDLAQTVSWLTAAPAVLEECARSVSQPQLLKALLLHEKCLGHLDSNASISPSIGDSILSSLSLPLSGQVCGTDQSESNQTPNIIQSPSTAALRSKSRQSKGCVSHIAPVIGSITSEDLPQKACHNVETMLEKDSDDLVAAAVSNHTKVKVMLCRDELYIQKMLPHSTINSVEEEEGPLAKALKRNTRSLTKKLRKTRSGMKLNEKLRSLTKELEHSSKTSRCVSQDELSPKAKSLAAVLASCRERQLQVTISRLNISDLPPTALKNIMAKEKETAESPRSSAKESVPTVRERTGVKRKRKHNVMSTPEKNHDSHVEQVCAGSPCIPKIMSVRMDNPDLACPVTESSDDIIIDSEDEATEKVKGRLFTEQYCKTKNNTYIPTLNEFWSPVFFRRDLLSPGNGCR